MNWTEDQVREHAARLSNPIPARQSVSPAPSKVRGMNKLEAEYAQELECEKRLGVILWWAFEPIKFRLAKLTTYTPDFMVFRVNWTMSEKASAGNFPGNRYPEVSRVEFHETKGGFWRDDARVKIKVVAEMYPMFKFVGITKRKVSEGGGWNVEEF
jgi:hypothetical protein